MAYGTQLHGLASVGIYKILETMAAAVFRLFVLTSQTK
jgi:hypothetical protein